MVARHHELTVNFITHHLNAILQTDLVHLFQFLTSPYATCGVMRIAEQEYGSLLIGTFGLEIFPIYFERVIHTLQSRLKHFTAVITDGGEETVIIRGKNQHFFARHRKSLDSYRHSRNNTCRIEDLFALDSPVMATTEPGDDSLIIILFNNGIAEDTMLSTLTDSFKDSRCSLEVHISHPKRNQIQRWIHIGIWSLIPLHATSTFALD